MKITAFDLAQRFTGIKEVPGLTFNNPQIMAMLKLDVDWPGNDEVPWCSAFVNYVCWLLRLPRSKSLGARTWLEVGQIVAPIEAKVGWDIVILKRGPHPQPGPEVIAANGHVGFFAGRTLSAVHVLGGNQGNAVCIKPYSAEDILGIRRLYSENMC